MANPPPVLTPQPLVSIIINNYNYEQFLPQCIDSALGQTYPAVEVIVVDDGSTDGSRAVIASYGERVIPLLQPNGKQATALNNGFAHSHGEIILFLDADDFLFPEAVEQIVARWQPELAKVHYRLAVVDGEGNSLGYSAPQGAEPLATGAVWQTLLNVGGYVSTPMSGNALSRQAVAAILPIPEAYRLTADDYLSMLIPFYGEVAAIETPLGAYRIHNRNQWALTTFTSERFQRFVRHDLQNCALLIEKANELGYPVPADLEQRSIGRLWSRLISLRLDPANHPVPTDTPLSLMGQGIRCLWKYSAFNKSKRVIYTLWFLWVGLMPLPLAQPAMAWLYAPQLRPRAVDWLLGKIRRLVSYSTT